MSIEKALADLTSAIQENTAVQTKVLAALTSGAKPAATSAKTETKAADKPATEKKATTPAKKADKAPTEKDLLDVFGGYLGSAADKAEKARLNDTIRPILDHFGATRVSEIASENYAEAIALGKKLVAAFNDGGVDAAEEVDLGLSNEAEEEEGEEDDVL